MQDFFKMVKLVRALNEIVSKGSIEHVKHTKQMQILLGKHGQAQKYIW